MKVRSSSGLGYLLLAAVCGLLFFWRLGAVPLIGLDEALYAGCSREMAASGNWLVPHYNGEPFFDKPPLVYWMQAASIRMLGSNALAARLQSAVAASLLVALVVYLGTRLFDRRVGLLAGYALATSLLAVGLARLCLLDQLLALTITAALGGWLLWHLELWPRSGLLVFWTAAGLGVMVKGPAALAILVVALVSYAAVSRQWKALRHALWWPGLLVFAAIVTPWYAAVHVATGGEFLREFIFHQNISRALGEDFHHNEPFLFYLPVYFAAFLPWSVYIPAAWSVLVRLGPQERKGRTALFAGAWLVGVVLLFSLLRSKLPSYIYPVLPPSALLVGALFSDAAVKGRSRVLRSATTAAVVVCIIFGGAMLAGQILLPEPIPGLPTALIPMGLALILGSAAARLMIWRRKAIGAFACLCAGATAMLAIAVGVGLPIAAEPSAEPARQIGAFVARMQPPPGNMAAPILQGDLPSLPFYARRKVMFDWDDVRLQQSVDSVSTLIVVAEESPVGLPLEGRLVYRAGRYRVYRYDPPR